MQYIHNNILKFVATFFLLAASLSWLGLATAFAGETRYVSGLITLKMYKDTTLNQGLKPLRSGDKVEVLKLDDGYSQIKTEQGVIGWVKSSYLKKNKPAVVRIIEIQEELDALRSKHTDLLIKNTTTPAEHNAGLQARVEAAESVRQSMEQRLNELEMERNTHINEIRGLKNKSNNKDKARSILLWVILPILTLITGFFIGYKFLDSKIRARFGGYNPL